MKYLVIIERAKNNYSAYIPDVPGCVATGKTPDEAREEIMKALKMHLEGLKEDGLPIPEPQAHLDYVAVLKTGDKKSTPTGDDNPRGIF